MYKKVSIFLIAVFILSGAMYGCGKSSANVQNQKTQAKTEKPKKEEPKKEGTKTTESSKVESEIFTIYKANEDTYKKEVVQQISVAKDRSLEEKLSYMAQELSELQFNKLPIEVVKVEDLNGKKIAKINLKEDNSNKKGWAKFYMQGSTGGNITSVSLAETFLQKEYKGTWIDGVEFLYNGKKCDFEHAPNLNEIIYRK